MSTSAKNFALRFHSVACSLGLLSASVCVASPPWYVPAKGSAERAQIMDTLRTRLANFEATSRNLIFVVTELSVPGLRQARRVADELHRRFDMPLKGRVIVNKARWLGSHGVKKRDAYATSTTRCAAPCATNPAVTRRWWARCSANPTRRIARAA